MEVYRGEVSEEFDWAVINELDRLCKKYNTKDLKQEPEEMDLGETMGFYGVDKDGFINVIKAMETKYSIDLSDITYEKNEYDTMIQIIDIICERTGAIE